MDKEYQLSQIIRAHADSIRDVGVYKDKNGVVKLATVSRDSHAKIFPFENGSISSTESFVYPIAVSVSSVNILEEPDREPLLFFGCLNGAIFVFIENIETPLNVLINHQHNVGVMATDLKTKFLASGSWDKSACIYDLKSEKIIFKIHGHTESVNDVHFLRPPLKGGKLCLLTASSDRTITLWDISEEVQNYGIQSPLQIQTFLGHQDCVRSLMLDSDQNGFYSVSNDQLIYYWRLDQNIPLRTFAGHSHFIYHIQSMSDPNYFMTCGEDRCIRIWNKLNCQNVQTLQVPVVSVWALQNLDQDTFVASTSDGKLYSYTKNPEKYASEEVLSTYQLSAARLNLIEQDTVFGIKLYEQSSLMNSEAITAGEQRLVRFVDDSVMLYEAVSNGKELGWIPKAKLKEYEPELDMDNDGKLFCNGHYYDNIIELKLGEKNIYRFGIQHTTDPWDAANAFIQEYHLDKNYLERIILTILQQQNLEPRKRFSSFPNSKFMIFDQFPPFDKVISKYEEFRKELEPNMDLTDVEAEIFHRDFDKPTQSWKVFHAVYSKTLNWPREKVFVVMDFMRKHLTDKLFAATCYHEDRKQFIRNIILAYSHALEPNVATSLTGFRVVANTFSSVYLSNQMLKEFTEFLQRKPSWKTLSDNKNVQLAFAAIWFNFSVATLSGYTKIEPDETYFLIDLLKEGIFCTSYVEVVTLILETFGNLIISKNVQTQTIKNNISSMKSDKFKFFSDNEVKRLLQAIDLLN